MKPANYLLIAVTLLILAVSTSALAHKVRIFAWQEGELILTESKFSGGRPAMNATVEVVNPLTGKILLSGMTDKAGEFSFPLSAVEQAGLKDLDIIIDSGDGHKNHWLYTLDESAPEELAQTSNQKPVQRATPTSVLPQETVDKSAAAAKTLQVSISREELQQLLATTIDKKLSPIKKTLAENAEKGPSLQDILGGLGYIFGLAGIAAYMQAKKNNQKE